MSFASDQRLTEFLNASADGTFYVGHASVLGRVNGKLFLVDGVFPKPLFLESWLFFPELVISEELLAVDGVFISHCHEDHYDPQFLRKLKKGTPIYITQDRIGFEEILNDKSLNVIQIPAFEKFKIPGDVTVIAMPSDHNNFDSSFIIKGRDFSFFQGNDNFLPESLLQKAFEMSGPVQQAYIPFSYVWWYPFCLTSMPIEQRRLEIKRLTELNMEIGAMMARVLQASVVIPSAGNLVFYESDESPINGLIALPFDFVDFVNEKHPNLAPKTYPLLSGDSVLFLNGKNQIKTAGIDRRGFNEKLRVFLNHMNSKMAPAKQRKQLDPGLEKFLNKKIAQKDLPKFELDLYFFRRDLPDKSLHVDMRNYKIDLVETPKDKNSSITFSIQNHAFEMWVNEEITFETLLNSQRLLIHRNPEVFERPVWDVIRSHF